MSNFKDVVEKKQVYFDNMDKIGYYKHKLSKILHIEAKHGCDDFLKQLDYCLCVLEKVPGHYGDSSTYQFDILDRRNIIIDELYYLPVKSQMSFFKAKYKYNTPFDLDLVLNNIILGYDFDKISKLLIHMAPDVNFDKLLELKSLSDDIKSLSDDINSSDIDYRTSILFENMFNDVNAIYKMSKPLGDSITSVLDGTVKNFDFLDKDIKNIKTFIDLRNKINVVITDAEQNYHLLSKEINKGLKREIKNLKKLEKVILSKNPENFDIFREELVREINKSKVSMARIFKSSERVGVFDDVIGRMEEVVQGKKSSNSVLSFLQDKLGQFKHKKNINKSLKM